MHDIETVINPTQAGTLYLLPPFLCFVSLDRKSVQFTIPLTTIRRVERLSSRAGVFALSLTVWHGMKIVSPEVPAAHVHPLKAPI